MYKTFGSYEYSQSRVSVPTLENTPLFYLDYNEYYGDIHDETLEVLESSADLLRSYFRPGDHSLESQLSGVYGVTDMKFHLVSGADHALEEILGYCRNQLNLKSFYSYHQTTYDHFYTFSQKLGLDVTSLESAEIVYVCCPNNPDGEILSVADCLKLAVSYPEKIFLFDFSYLAYTNESYTAYLDVLKNLSNAFFISSLAKIYPIAGLRAGWLCTTLPMANLYFDRFLNAKMINPVARRLLKNCLELHMYYREQTREIFSNRKGLADIVIEYLSKQGMDTSLKYPIESTGGNFFSLHFSQQEQISKAIQALEEVHLYVRHKSHWDFIRMTSVNDTCLSTISERLQ